MKKLASFITIFLIALFTATPAAASGGLVFLNDVDNPATIEQIKETLTAADDLDGDLTANITVFEDNYTGNESTIGTYDVIFSVTDSAGQTTLYTVIVDNRDISAPDATFEDYNGENINVPKDATIPEITAAYLPALIINDGHAGILDETAITYHSLLDDPEAIDTTTPGEYPQVIRFTDSSGNESELSYTLQVREIIDTPGFVFDPVHNVYSLLGIDWYFWVAGLLGIGFIVYKKKR